MKKTVFILILFICAQAVFAAEYKDVFLGGGNTGMKAAEIGGTTYMPADALSLFGKDAVYQNGYLSVNNKYYSIRNIDERPYLLSDDFKEITGAGISTAAGRVNVTNMVSKIQQDNERILISLVFPAEYSVRLSRGSLYVELKDVGISGLPAVYDSVSEKVKRVDHETLPHSLVLRFDLAFVPDDFLMMKGKEAEINIPLSGFDNKVIRKVERIRFTQTRDSAYELTLKNGALTDPVISCDVYTGIYTIKLGAGEISSGFNRSVKGMKAYVNEDKEIIVESDHIREAHLAARDNDLAVVFDPPVIKPITEAVITIDPGHGGSEPGAEYAGTQEKDLNLLNALRAAEELRKNGATVIMTRTDDSAHSLNERGKLAIDTASDLLISFHINSCGTPNTGTGTETYYHKDFTLSKYYGTLFHDCLMQNNDIPDRKVRSDTRMYASGFAVLRTAQTGGVPAILMEVAFINNDKDRVYLFSEDYRNKIAQDVVTSVKAYLTKLPINRM